MTRNTANYHSLSSAGTCPVQTVLNTFVLFSINTLKTSELPSNVKHSEMYIVLNYKE